MCVFVFVQAHAGCWMAIKVSRLFFCGLEVLACTKLLWKDFEKHPFEGMAVTYVHSDTGQQF